MRMTAMTTSVWIQLPDHQPAVVPVLTAGPVAYQRPRPKYPKSQSSSSTTMMSSMSPMSTSARPHIG